MKPIFSTPILAAIAAIATLALAPAAARAQDSSQAAPGPDCGAEIQKVNGTAWKCTFADDFDGKELDRSKWSVMETATMGLSHGGECFVDEPENIGVANGFLTLTATMLSAPEWCGWFDTPYRSGMVFTGDKFAQTYGRFEARVRFPEGAGFASGWWMWPLEQAYGRQSGEIDIVEHYGAYPTYVAPSIHIIDPTTGGERGRSEYCTIDDPQGKFHTYAVEWRRLEGFTFLYDGVPCMRLATWDPGGDLAFPQPFDRPFFLQLTLALGYGENAAGPTTRFPGKFVVDYVRAWE
jgi:beta-glucanase (GH16 family)